MTINERERDAVSVWQRQGTITAVCGLGFLILFGAGFFYFALFATMFYPSPFGPPVDVLTFFAENRGGVQAVSFLYALAAILLLGFAAFFSELVGRTIGEMGALPSLTLGGGAVSAAFLLLSALCLWVLSREATLADPALVRTLHDLVYLTGGPAHVAAFAPFLGALGIATVRSRVLPAWIGWIAVAAAILSLPSLAALLWQPAAYLLPIARLITYAWILVVSLALMVGWPPQAQEQEKDLGPVEDALRVRPDRIEAAPDAEIR
jgi:hypothetical protein